MKRIIVGVALLMVLGMSGCGAKKEVENEVKTHSNIEQSNVCGVVREIATDAMKIQLCGNIFEGISGACYITVNDIYDDINVGSDVLVYYSGQIKYKVKDKDIEVYDINVIDVKKYENDGVFKAHVFLDMVVDENGEEYPADDPRGGTNYYIEPLENEYECNFEATYIRGDVSSIEQSVMDSQKEVTVTYDLDTMEVISIIQ